MRVVIRLLSSVALLAFVCLFGTDVLSQPHCARGQKGGCISAPRQAPRGPIALNIRRCVVPGRWTCTDSGGQSIQLSIGSNLTGIGVYSYCPDNPASETITLTGPNTFHEDVAVSPNCLASSSDNTFGDSCHSFSGPFLNSDGSGGEWSCNLLSQRQAAISAAKPVVPRESRVEGGEILTRVELNVVVTDRGQPVPGVSLSMDSDRASDTVTDPALPTDPDGVASAKVETRDQTSASTLSVNSPDISTPSPTTFNWLPAHYEDDFLVTCYVISLESDFTGSPLIGPVNGLPADRKYHQAFIQDVKLQGSGVALDGSTIHYDGHGAYSVQPCAYTAIHVCAVDGTTVAVDFNVIPRRANTTISTLGSRQAQDRGGAIVDFHIDEFFGTRRAACVQAGRRTLGVDFSSY